jgi:hypothetical protein
MPQLHLIPLAEHARGLRDGSILADPSLAPERAIENLIMRAQIEAGIRSLLHKDILLVAPGNEVAKVLWDIGLREDDARVRVRLAVEDEDEIRRIVQRVVHEELEIGACERRFVVGVGDERALVVGRLGRVEGFEKGGLGDGARGLFYHAQLLAGGFFGGERDFDDGRLGVAPCADGGVAIESFLVADVSMEG